MPTVLSSTDLGAGSGPRSGSGRVARSVDEARRSARDVRSLFGFRLSGLRGRSRRAAPMALGVMLLLSLVAAVVPAQLPEQGVSRHDVAVLLPSALLSVLAIAIVSAATTGGGRELLPREQAVAFPVSPTTDHLGALLMAPLNIAWLLECWGVLAGASYAVGGRTSGVAGAGSLLAAQVPVVLWLLAATSTAQVLAWGIEWVRRGPHGTLLVRGAAALLALTVTALVVSHRLVPALDHSPTTPIALGVLDGAAHRWLPWAAVVASLLVATAVAVAVGARVAGHVVRRPARDELRVESSRHAARANPASDLVALMRTDRAAVWRSVPMRRGILVLALSPGLVALAGSFDWRLLSIFPGLVASGGALLFGVNSWCLDGRGALWRDSLPVAPGLVLASRSLVLLEVLLGASVLTLAIAGSRAGLPTRAELAAVTCATVVVTVQVVATALRWSVRHPYAVDLRSARATPAPPLVMVGYSARLALGTTVTGLLFDTAALTSWGWSVALAVPLLAWSALRMARTGRAWSDPVTRSRVVATVAA